MKQATQKKTELQFIEEKFDLEKADLTDIADRLWFEYYCPAKPHDKETKRFIMTQYNIVADIMNKIANKKIMVNITPSMVWDNSKNEMPTLDNDKKIYVDTIVFDAKVVREQVSNKKSELRAAKKKPDTSNAKLVKAKPESKKETPVVQMNDGEKDLSKYGKNKKEIIWKLHADGKTKDEIIAITGYTRKVISDMIWHYNQQKK